MKKIIRVIAIVLVVYCSFQLIGYGKDTVVTNVTKAEINNKVFLPIRDRVDIRTTIKNADMAKTDILKEVKKEVKETKPRIDFLYLKTLNSDVTAYISYESLGINYPIVNSFDNEDYLHTDFYGNKSFAGTLFQDCSDTKKDWSFNHLIYGHNMKNCTMFGMLSHAKKGDTFYIYLPDKRMKYEVVQIETISPDDNFYTQGRLELKDTVSLSTCKGKNRLVVTGKKIKEVKY